MNPSNLKIISALALFGISQLAWSQQPTTAPAAPPKSTAPVASPGATPASSLPSAAPTAAAATPEVASTPSPTPTPTAVAPTAAAQPVRKTTRAVARPKIEEEPAIKGVWKKQIGVGLSLWQEILKLEQSGGITTDKANFYGTQLMVRAYKQSETFGYGLGLTAFTGRANGGGNNTLNYTASKVPFTGFAVLPGVNYSISENVQVELIYALLLRQINWTSSSTVTVTSGRASTAFPLFSMNLNFSERLSLVQSLGSMSADGGTFWMVAVARTW